MPLSEPLTTATLLEFIFTKILCHTSTTGLTPNHGSNPQRGGSKGNPTN